MPFFSGRRKDDIAQRDELITLKARSYDLDNIITQIARDMATHGHAICDHGQYAFYNNRLEGYCSERIDIQDKLASIEQSQKP